MSGRTVSCPTCKGTDIDYDPARGDSACMQCGTVVEENAIVAEVGFVEDKRGRSSMIGQFVSGNGTGSVLAGFGREATEITMSNGRRKINHLCASLGLARTHGDAALRMFRMAVERGFHKGRRTANVACACLYFVCRREKTPHMLIDFSDVLETNVYHLGNTFLKFARLMCVPLPVVDPSLYIHRFAGKLEFPDDKKHAIAMSALRLLARMKRDWMSVGRRPSGLCGAALIIAARMHNFHRSRVDVARVVRVGNYVLRERLLEIDQTPSAHLTAEQIDAGGGDDGIQSIRDEMAPCDPPAFRTRNKEMKRKLVNKEKENDGVQPTKRPRTADIAESKDEGDVEKEMAAALASDELQELEKEASTEEEAAKLHPNIGGQKSSEKDGAARQEEKESFSDLDDDELEGYLNNDEEYKVKENVWMEINKDYLEEQERLEKLKIENPEEYKRLRPWKARKTNANGSPKKTKADTPAEAAEMAVGKKASKKLNYAVLEDLFASTMGKGTSDQAAENGNEDVNKSVPSFDLGSTVVPSRRRKASQSV
eukprot:Plantae.Rhodophyta-Hildenbrandia_rubra.ctg37373.p1 GENE.Plantae.Rhodophyta-Hildenbrandia_rubra.ctg37373~~Plantae.Rhodophyta-Hildenbrandia_rubra.ctg37373.p1  ORF type:complete len:540 (-),score=139.23 Plantae.Rhodophyta-Hildenbrandia_rubra.ctg37373:593-2212(-)